MRLRVARGVFIRISGTTESACRVVYNSSRSANKSGLHVIDRYLENDRPVCLNPRRHSSHPPLPPCHPPPSHHSQPPSTLHPSPFTLHPSPSTLHPSPSTLHPSPFTLQPPPSTRHPKPAIPKPSMGYSRIRTHTALGPYSRARARGI